MRLSAAVPHCGTKADPREPFPQLSTLNHQPSTFLESGERKFLDVLLNRIPKSASPSSRHGARCDLPRYLCRGSPPGRGFCCRPVFSNHGWTSILRCVAMEDRRMNTDFTGGNGGNRDRTGPPLAPLTPVQSFGPRRSTVVLRPLSSSATINPQLFQNPLPEPQNVSTLISRIDTNFGGWSSTTPQFQPLICTAPPDLLDDGYSGSRGDALIPSRDRFCANR
jgi:hypothetical protein